MDFYKFVIDFFFKDEFNDYSSKLYDSCVSLTTNQRSFSHILIKFMKPHLQPKKRRNRIFNQNKSKKKKKKSKRKVENVLKSIAILQFGESIFNLQLVCVEDNEAHLILMAFPFFSLQGKI